METEDSSQHQVIQSLRDISPSSGGLCQHEAAVLPLLKLEEVPPLNTEGWLRRLQHGAVVALDGGPVRVALDAELGCLEIREHDLLYPLAELKTCTELRSSGQPEEGDAYDLEVSFADFDVLLFQFDDVVQRAGFAAALDTLATFARKGLLTEGGYPGGIDIVD